MPRPPANSICSVSVGALDGRLVWSIWSNCEFFKFQIEPIELPIRFFRTCDQAADGEGPFSSKRVDFSLAKFIVHLIETLIHASLFACSIRSTKIDSQFNSFFFIYKCSSKQLRKIPLAVESNRAKRKKFIIYICTNRVGNGDQF